MRCEGALRLSCGAGGVHDRGIILGSENDLDRASILEVFPAIRIADDIVQRGDSRVGDLVSRVAGDQDVLQVRQAFKAAADALIDLRVDDRYRDPGEGEAVLQFLGGPPRVHRSGNGAGAYGGEEADRPFRIVAHDHRDPVTLADMAVQVKMPGKLAGAELHRLEGDALVFIDDVCAVAKLLCSRIEDGGDGRRGVFIDLERDAPDYGVLKLYRRSGTCERCVCSRDRHDGSTLKRAFCHDFVPPECLVDPTNHALHWL